MPRLYAIADAARLGGHPDDLIGGVETLCQAGVGWIQTRCKSWSDAVVWSAYRDVQAVIRRRPGPRWWINDRTDLVALFEADGVQLGQEDLDPAAARSVLGAVAWIGRSTHDWREVEAAAADPEVDVIAIGPIFPTRSKANARPVVGLDLLRRARERCPKPLVAIGGIDADNAASVLAAGANSVAVLGAICDGDVATNARRLLVATAP